MDAQHGSLRGSSHGRSHGSFSVDELAYELPESLIAAEPAARREDARMLVLDRDGDRDWGGRDRPAGGLHDAHITDLPNWLRSGDLVILNDTKVLQARFAAQRKTGGRVQGLFLEETNPGRWRVMLEGSGRLRPDETLTVAPDSDRPVAMTLIEYDGEGIWHVTVEPTDGDTAAEILDRVGQPPLPPYILRRRRDVEVSVDDRHRYQTVYAKHDGAVAAPTAGLHITQQLLTALRDQDITTATVTLHVGIGTFRPIKVGNLQDHAMHGERMVVSTNTAEAIRACRQRGGRVVAVGTTSVRVLESAALRDGSRTVQPMDGTTELFIYPPFEFAVVDVMLTNFHLPKSTLLAMLMAFAGIEPIRNAYRRAVERRYRFFSYGDAMLILSNR